MGRLLVWRAYGLSKVWKARLILESSTLILGIRWVSAACTKKQRTVLRFRMYLRKANIISHHFSRKHLLREICWDARPHIVARCLRWIVQQPVKLRTYGECFDLNSATCFRSSSFNSQASYQSRGKLPGKQPRQAINSSPPTASYPVWVVPTAERQISAKLCSSDYRQRRSTWHRFGPSECPFAPGGRNTCAMFFWLFLAASGCLK